MVNTQEKINTNKIITGEKHTLPADYYAMTNDDKMIIV